MRFPKQRNYFAIILSLFLTLSITSKAQIWTQSFETDQEGMGYTSSNTFNDGVNDHFSRTDGTDVSAVAGSYSGINGTFFWAGEDLDDDGSDGSASKTLTFDPIDITGLASVQFRGLFGTGNPDNGWDDSDVLTIEYNIDAAGWLPLIEFTTDAPGSNQGLYYDSNDDGTGDVQLTEVLQQFVATLPSAGASLELRVIATANSGSEEFAFDHFEVYEAVAVDGCTDPAADNYDPTATNDDGSCIFSGCTDAMALNYDPMANLDDGSCIFSLPAIVINEIHYNPCTDQGDDGDYEFIELYNNDVVTVDLTGWQVINAAAYTFGTASIAPGEYIVIATNSLSYEGNGYQVFQFDSGAFNNTGETITLVDAGSNTVDEAAYSSGTPWPAAANGGCSTLELIDPNLDNTDVANWQASFDTNGTPGAENSTAPPATSYTINELQSEDHTDEFVSTSGVVTAVYGASNLFTIQDGQGAYSGIWVAGSGVALGDEVDVQGIVVENFDLTQINATEITVLTSGNALPTNEVLTTLAVNDEQWEGVLVSVQAIVDNGDVGFGEWSVDDTSGNVLVDDLGYLVAPVDEGVEFNVVGPVYYSFGAYKIEPRDEFDVVRYGCTDDTFANYDPLATVDNGTCANTPGCTNPDAENYDPEATEDDGSCIVNGCTDDTALNYDPAATNDDGSCYFTEPLIVINEVHYNPCADQGDDLIYEFVELYNNDVITVDLSGFTFPQGFDFTFPEGTMIAPGEYIVLAVTAATYEGNGYQVFEIEFGNFSNSGETIELQDAFGNQIDIVSYDDIAPWPTTPDGGCATLELIDPSLDNTLGENWQGSYVDNGTPGAENSTIPTGCTDPEASNYDPLALEDDGSCEYLGCTDPDAPNYDPMATTDDGSCIYFGCTYAGAENFDPMANDDDGSCVFNTVNPCPADLNYDGVVNAADLLEFLGAFGSACD